MRISLIGNLAENSSALNTSGELLSLPFGNADRQRLAAIGNPSALLESLSARLALKRLCPDGKDIAYTERGKPYFTEQNAPAFSLSHTKSISGAALSEDGEGLVGLDIELIGASRRFSLIAERFFTPSELSRFEAQGGSEEAFLAVWTEKEARAKLYGTGLASALSEQNEGDGLHYYRYLISANGVRAALTAASQYKAKKITFVDCEDFLIYELQN